MPQAVVTRYHGPTEKRPARYSAEAPGPGRRYFSAAKCEEIAADRPGWGGNIEGTHGAALRLYLADLPHPWSCEWIGGHLPPDGAAMVWVSADGPKESA